MSAFPEELSAGFKAMLDRAEDRAEAWKKLADSTRSELLRTQDVLNRAEARLKELETVLLKRLEEVEESLELVVPKEVHREALYNAWEEGYEACADTEDIEIWKDIKPFNPYREGYDETPTIKVKATTLAPIPVFDGKDEERLKLYQRYSNGEITYNAYTNGLHDLEFLEEEEEDIPF